MNQKKCSRRPPPSLFEDEKPQPLILHFNLRLLLLFPNLFPNLAVRLAPNLRAGGVEVGLVDKCWWWCYC
jgi:hypothetical protein